MKRVEITGVVEDGTHRGRGVPYDARVPLVIVRGQAVTLSFRVVTSAGVPVSLTGKKLAFSAKKHSDDATFAIRKTSDTGGSEITLLATETAVAPGRYIFDVWLGSEQIVPLSTLTLAPGVGP